jgi:agmatinase
MSKADKIASFDFNGAGNVEGGIFGLPFTVEESDIVVLPVRWDVTVSYGDGTVDGPDAVWAASPQLDLVDEDYGDVWKHGIAMSDALNDLAEQSIKLRQHAKQVIAHQEQGGSASDPQLAPALKQVNEGCSMMVKRVFDACTDLLNSGKKVVLLGGDHSTPMGYLQALAKRHGDFGILQIDAHMDLRIAYEGFTWSHASIMYNALSLPEVTKLVQVGVRDFCSEELEVAAASGGRALAYSGRQLARKSIQGETWAQTCDEIVSQLPHKVYLSFDIDGLEPFLCPHTGTPVAGGLGYEQVMYLLDLVGKSGREVIGADLVEVAPGDEGDDWDGNVGARILYRLCGIVSR